MSEGVECSFCGEHHSRKEEILHELEMTWCRAGFYDLPQLKKDLWSTGSPHLQYRPSTIESAGNGLFTTSPIPSRSMITWYAGPVLTASDYAKVKARDPEAWKYARAVDLAGNWILLGNYSKKIAPIPASEMATAFQGDGAAQFMNGARSYAAPSVNVGTITVRSNRLLVHDLPPSANDTPETYLMRNLEHKISTERTLMAAYPDDVMLVAVALEDIPADTELIASYGVNYFDKLTRDKVPAYFRRR